MSGCSLQLSCLVLQISNSFCRTIKVLHNVVNNMLLMLVAFCPGAYCSSALSSPRVLPRRKAEVMLSHGLFSLLTERLMLNSNQFTMTTYNVLFEVSPTVYITPQASNGSGDEKQLLTAVCLYTVCGNVLFKC